LIPDQVQITRKEWLITIFPSANQDYKDKTKEKLITSAESSQEEGAALKVKDSLLFGPFTCFGSSHDFIYSGYGGGE
jgi:hypothetical protein